jgi:hypothetical protein
MKGLKEIFLVLGIVGLVCLGGYIVYQIAHATGQTVGYEHGYVVGEGAGYSVGKQDGYQQGYTVGETAGYDTGYDEGYDLGNADGYDEGYDLGNADGYDQGYDVGVADSLGHGYDLRDPTYKEVLSFLRQDKTDRNEYIEDTYGVYVCSHFARDVGNNAEAAGLRAAYVSLRYPDSGHAIVAFNTVDEGLVYFEPRTDERVRPVVDKRYYECVEPKPGYYYAEPDFDDTIKDILVIW